MPLPTQIHKNFLSDAEVDIVRKHLQVNGDLHDDFFSNYSKDKGHTVSNTFWYWDYENDQVLQSLINDRLDRILGKRVVALFAHMVQSNVPYYLHNDAFLPNNKNRAPEYTAIISLGDYDASTVVFNEYVETYDSWISNSADEFKKNNLLPNKLLVDPRFYVEYLDHIEVGCIKGYTVETVFEWRKGDLLLFDRKKFHCGTNFLKKGLKNKVGIVLWTVYN